MPNFLPYTTPIAELLGDFLRQITHGGTDMYPILCTAVSINGSLLFVRYYDGGRITLECELLAQHTEGEGDAFMLPINFMFIDKDGKAYRAVITKEGGRVLH